jgi:cell division protein FtsI/penicillin-binding protein 2
MTIGLAILLFAGGAVSQTPGAASPPGRQGSYFILNPKTGSILAVGTHTIVVVSPKTGKVLAVGSHTIFVVNPKTGQIVLLCNESIRGCRRYLQPESLSAR